MGRQHDLAIIRSLQRIEQQLATLVSRQTEIATKEKDMLDDLIAAVDEQTTAVDAVVGKIEELIASGTITAEQQAKIAELASKVRANSQRLSDAAAR